MGLLKKWHDSAVRQPDAGYVGVIDGVRVLAIGLVAWFHIWQQSWLWPGGTFLGIHVNLDPVIRSGYIWVDIMILVSGFCLWLPWARLSPDDPAPDWRTFYRKRVARIIPSYALSVIVTYAACVATGFYASGAQGLRDLFRHLTFTQVFSYDTYYNTPLNAGLWTIAVEMHFYLLFPLIAKVFRRFPAATTGVMIAISVCFRSWVAVHIPDIGIWFNQLAAYLDVFAIGMFGAHIYVRLSKMRRNVLMPLVSGILAAAAFAVLINLAMGQSRSMNTEEIRLGQMSRRLMMALAGIVLILGTANAGPILRGLFSNPVTHFLAGVSMQFYIWHQVMAVQFRYARIIPSIHENPNYMGDTVWQGRYTLLCWLGALALAVLLTYGFERPIARRVLKGKKEV